MRARAAAWAAVVVIALLVAWYAGSRSGQDAPPPPVGSVRLGPDPGQPVADYLAALPAQLPAPGPVVPALVALDAELTVPAAAALAGPAAVDTVVLRVALPRVQTALRFEAPDPGVAPATALDVARTRAALAAGADAARLTGRPGAIAAAERAALDSPGCACVVALVVLGDRADLDRLAATPGVRAVQAAPAGTTAPELALAPLLPEQTVRADPLPDDGPVPTG